VTSQFTRDLMILLWCHFFAVGNIRHYSEQTSNCDYLSVKFATKIDAEW